MHQKLYLGWNNNSPIFKDKMVRRAMTYLCNREQIIESIYYNDGQIAKSSVYFKRPEYNDEIVPYPFNPNEARKLLQERGWKDSDGDGILDKIIDGQLSKFTFRF